MYFRAILIGILALMGGLAADWPQFLGPNRDGHSPEKGLLASWPKGGPRRLWQREVGEGYSGPVVASGRLILFHRQDGKEIVDCLDAATGKPIWQQSYAVDYLDSLRKGNGPRGTPCLAGGKVYTLGVTGVLTCCEMKTGRRLWQRELHRDYTVRDSYFGVGTSPLVEGNLVLVNIGGRDGAGIVGLNKDTGKEVWKATDDDASYSSPIVADLAGERRAAFFTRAGLVLLNPRDGKVTATKRWRARIDTSVNAAAPVALGRDHLFLSASYDTGAVLLEVEKSGKVRDVWKSKAVLSAHFSTPVAVGPLLIGFEGRQEEGARLRCIDWKSGKVHWTKDGFGCGSLVAADGKLFVMAEKGDLVLVEPAVVYREKARASVLAGPVRAHLALAEGRLYARDQGKLVCWAVKE